MTCSEVAQSSSLLDPILLTLEDKSSDWTAHRHFVAPLRWRRAGLPGRRILMWRWWDCAPWGGDLGRWILTRSLLGKEAGTMVLASDAGCCLERNVHCLRSGEGPGAPVNHSPCLFYVSLHSKVQFLLCLYGTEIKHAPARTLTIDKTLLGAVHALSTAMHRAIICLRVRCSAQNPLDGGAATELHALPSTWTSSKQMQVKE